MKRVLIVDDSSYMRSLVRESLESGDYEIVGEAANGEQAIDLAYDLEPDLITLDNVMPDMLGLEVLKALSKGSLECKIVIVSAVGQDSMKAKGIELGAIGYVTKPFTKDGLVGDIDEMLSNSQVKAA